MTNTPEVQDAAVAMLRGLFKKAVDAADPKLTLAEYLPSPPDPAKGRTLLIAAGKAAASMAAAVETAWPRNAPLSGTALTRYGHGEPCERVEVIEAAHPVPDNRGHEAAQRLMREVSGLGENDLLLFLVSGGGSSLLALPAEGITLDEKKQVNRALLMSGAPIGEMNCVRKHLSAIKGGRLAAAAQPARVVTLAISDVPGDDPSTIASGPTVPDPTTLEEARAIIEEYGISVPDSVSNRLRDEAAETPKADAPIFDNCHFEMVSTPSQMLDAVLKDAHKNYPSVLSLGADIEGEARVVGEQHAALALQQDRQDETLILSGGETTVTVEPGQQGGRGGRNCEYLLSLAIALDGSPGIYAIAADTDGIDGSEDNAGAIVTPDTLVRAAAKGLDAKAMLAAHDSYSFFAELGDLIVTGPTRTNVNDFRAIYIAPSL